MLSCHRRALGIFAVSVAASLAHAQFAQFSIEAEHASGQFRGQPFTDQPIRFTFLMDTQTGTATFGGGGGSTIYEHVATSARLDIAGEQLVQHGLGRLFLTEDEGFDYLVADVFGLHTTFWRNWTDGPFSDPAFERPLSTVLIPGKYVPLLIDPRFGDVLPNHITGTFTALDSDVMITAAQIRSLSLSLVPAPGTGAAGLAAFLGFAARRRRRH
jgi:MYXO-CTERM domain-containing protein